MRRSILFIIRRQLFLFAFILVMVFSGEVNGQTGGVALLLQQSPSDGGRITPVAGVHHFESGVDVRLTAVARPGYQFVYWLGDVSDITSSSTVVYLDSPKIVIAVFERVEYEILAASEISYSTPEGGGLYRSAGDYSRQEGGGGGAKRPHKYRWPTPPEEYEEPKPEELEDYFPVPDEGENYLPVPDEQIPEPGSVFLFGLGCLLLRRRCKTRKA